MTEEKEKNCGTCANALKRCAFSFKKYGNYQCEIECCLKQNERTPYRKGIECCEKWEGKK